MYDYSFFPGSCPFTVYSVQETEDVLCVELDTPEKNKDKDDIVMLGSKPIISDQDEKSASKGKHSEMVIRDNPTDFRAHQSLKKKGMKRRKPDDRDDEGESEPKLTSKQVFELVQLHVHCRHLAAFTGETTLVTPCLLF